MVKISGQAQFVLADDTGYSHYPVVILRPYISHFAGTCWSCSFTDKEVHIFFLYVRIIRFCCLGSVFRFLRYRCCLLRFCNFCLFLLGGGRGHFRTDAFKKAVRIDVQIKFLCHRLFLIYQFFNLICQSVYIASLDICLVGR